MSDVPADPVDPLLRAIAEFRREVDRLFDEQAARLSIRARDSALDLPVPAAPEPSDEIRGRAPDPRPRLDALAKHLDRRRRLGAGTGPDASERRERVPEPGTTPRGSPRR
jgi:hypothetical protein